MYKYLILHGGYVRSKIVKTTSVFLIFYVLFFFRLHVKTWIQRAKF